MDRRAFLKAVAAVGGGLALGRAIGSTLGGVAHATGASRYSKLDPNHDLMLVHTDLHNHSVISGDAVGDPGLALQQMRSAGIDVACLTEHAVSGKNHGQYDCGQWHYGDCRFAEGIDDNDWVSMAAIANAAYVEDQFVTFRGFEYSTPTIGHINVWFGSDFTDPAHEEALATPRALAEMWRPFPDPPQSTMKQIADNFQNAPDIAQIAPFYDWLSSAPGSLPFGGGNDAIACFNHPGYFGNFQDFVFHSGAASRIFLIEAFNSITYPNPDHSGTATDYFWYGRDRGLPQPFNLCFNQGWRVGFTGVSDEHSGTFGQAGKGRGGLYVSRLTRGAVQSAIMTRRSFGTRIEGLRLDSTLNGIPMGSSMPRPSGPVLVALDIDAGDAWPVGKPLYVQVIGSGANDPTLVNVLPITVPGPTDPPVTFTLDQPSGPWLFLRITDPDRATDPLGVAPFETPQSGGAIAYASPWYFD
ncbi:MAG: CehA/McbA family metallohydrolase domain-containing protein [Actinomycetota bacterium]